MRTVNNRGFTLVEVLVAAAITAVSLVSVVAFVRAGNEKIELDDHRRAARGIVDRTLENSIYQPENYKNLVTNTAPAPKDTVMDPGELHGALSIAISDTTPVQSYSGIPVARRKITVTMAWKEPWRSDSEKVSMEKWLTNVQRE